MERLPQSAALPGELFIHAREIEFHSPAERWRSHQATPHYPGDGVRDGARPRRDDSPDAPRVQVQANGESLAPRSLPAVLVFPSQQGFALPYSASPRATRIATPGAVIPESPRS